MAAFQSGNLSLETKAEIKAIAITNSNQSYECGKRKEFEKEKNALSTA